MKNPIPQYTFYKTKYGSELLIDVVELKYIKRFLSENPIHRLTYYDITFVTEGEGTFSIDNKNYEATSCDVFFSQPGEIRSWDTNHITNGYALIFEDRFLSSVFKDSLFVQHLSFFGWDKCMLRLLQNIKAEIDGYKQNDIHVLRALLYEALMLLDRTYQNEIPVGTMNKESRNIHISGFIKLVDIHLREHHSVQFYADKLCVTPNYLNELMNTVMSISAKQYIQDRVIDEVRGLLVYTNTSISELAFEFNFSSVSYFIRAFRQCTGYTPLAYRKEHKP